jgi:hypothetical protein
MPVASPRTIQTGLRFHGQSPQQFQGSRNVVEALVAEVPPPTISSQHGKGADGLTPRIAPVEPANQPIISF